MEQVKEFFKDFTLEKLINLLGEDYFIFFCFMLVLIIAIFVFTCIYVRTKKLKKIVTYEDNNVRYFSIHYEKDYVYSVDKRNLSSKRKENIEWFYSCFSPGERLRLAVWLSELMKVDHIAPNHLEVTTKVKENISDENNDSSSSDSSLDADVPSDIGGDSSSDSSSSDSSSSGNAKAKEKLKLISDINKKLFDLRDDIIDDIQ